MKKSEAIAKMRLVKYDIGCIIYVSNFDVPHDTVTRTVYYSYADGSKWVWLWGEFYRCKRVGNGYKVLEEA